VNLDRISSEIPLESSRYGPPVEQNVGRRKPLYKRSYAVLEDKFVASISPASVV
jgi:hypothetical protein